MSESKFKSTKSLIAVGLLATLFQAAFEPASAYISGAKVEDSQWPVFQIETHFPLPGVRVGDSARTCTGSLITPQLILLAAHCLRSAEYNLESTLKIRKGSSVTAVQINQVYVHPDSVSEVVNGTIHQHAANCNFPDVALISIRQPLPFALVKVENRATANSSSILTIAGYGKRYEGQPYYGWGGESTNPLSGGQKKLIKYNGTCLFVGGQGTSFVGDSGAPLFLNDSRVGTRAVGVVSWGVRDKVVDGYPLEAYSRLDDGSPTSMPMSAWINSVLRGTATPLRGFPSGN